MTPEFLARPILPELIVAGAAIIGLGYEAFAKRSDRRIHLVIAFLGLALASVAAVRLWDWAGEPTALAGMVSIDRLGVVAVITLLAVAAAGLLLAAHYDSRLATPAPGELYPLVMFAVTGMALIVVAADLVMVFIALEILSLSLYVLTGITGTARGGEAALKYFLLGAATSAFFLYGIAMAYGAANTTSITGLAHALAAGGGSQPLALVALVLLVTGFAFKVSSAPFHMWTPDVYQGAPTPVTAFMSAATKIAAFVALIRVLTVAMQPLTWDWQPVIWVLAALSIIVGSLLAIAQTDVKRMLAYSSVAHAGFVLTGLVNGTSRGIAAALFYLLVYAVMTIGAFGVVMLVSGDGDERSGLDSFTGLGKRRPGLAALMAIFLLSLGGIPPTAGFIAKVGVFAAATDAGAWPLVLIGVLASVASAYVYLRVVARMYLPAPDAAMEDVADGALVPQIGLAIPAAIILVLGIVPGLVTGLIEQASVLRW
jgi:NADH-quinone oxidoreductase subunit N